MKIVFLVASFMPHQIAVIENLIQLYDAEIVAYTVNIGFDYIPKDKKRLTCVNFYRSSKKDILSEIVSFDPDLVVVAGWLVPDYVWIAKQLRITKQIPVVAYSDTQWRGTVKQRVNCIISPWYVKKAFSHIWVAGMYQFEYARKLGFDKDRIIFNALSCDVDLFKRACIENKTENYPLNFLYIGRFVPVKGLEYLASAWSRITDKRGWTLTLIGDGPLKDSFQAIENIIIKDFMSHEELLSVMKVSGCFILPSIYEPWALVIHEAAAAGMPIIATDICGAVPHLLIDGYNGYKVKPQNAESLKIAMEKIINSDNNQLLKFCYNSQKLAQSITPSIGSANLISLLEKK